MKGKGQLGEETPALGRGQEVSGYSRVILWNLQAYLWVLEIISEGSLI